MKYGTASSRAGAAAPSRRQLANVDVLDLAPPVEVADDPCDGHARHASERRQRTAVGGLRVALERDIGEVGAGREVARLEAVDDRPALEGQAAANGVDPRIRRRQPGRDVELQDDAVARAPAPRQLRVSRRDRLAVDDRAARPRRHPERERPLRVAARDHLDRHGPRPRVARLDRQLDGARGRHDGADRRGRVLMELDAAVAGRGEVVVQRGEQAHDVRRAAGDGVPAVAALAASRLQRVRVEERPAVEREAREEAVVERPLEQVGEAALARHEQQPPVPHDAGDGRAGLAVGAVGRQLVGIADRLVVVARADPAGQVGLRRGQVVPLPQHRREQRLVSGLGVEIGDSGGEVERTDGVADDRAGLPYRLGVLVVAEVEPAARERAEAAPRGQERVGELEVAALARLRGRARRARPRSPDGRRCRSPARCGRRRRSGRRIGGRPRGGRCRRSPARMRLLPGSDGRRSRARAPSRGRSTATTGRRPGTSCSGTRRAPARRRRGRSSPERGRSSSGDGSRPISQASASSHL